MTNTSKITISSILGILAFVTVLFTLLVINHSFSKGRLLYEVDYEDVITFQDGLQRYRDLAEDGSYRLLSEYLLNPAHAPLHSALAASGFFIFGVHDWAPYAANSLLLFALLGAVLYVLRPISGYAKIAGFLFILASPLAFHTVHEFRPDYPNAIASVWGILLFFEFQQRRLLWLLAASGACFGLALLAKPPVFLYVLALGGGCVFWGIGSAWFHTGRQECFRYLKRLWPFFLGCFLVAGPHFIIAAKKIWSYFLLNQYGSDSHIWAFHEGWPIRLLYHFTGYGGQLGFGRMWIIALFAFGISILIAFYGKRKNPAIAHIAGILCGMSTYAYFFLAINPHMNPFFGLTFQILVLLAGAVAVSWCVSQLGSGVRASLIAALGMLLVLLAIAVAFRLPVRKSEFTNGPLANRKFLQEAPKKTADLLTKLSHITDGRYVIMTSYGVLSSATLKWMTAKDSVDLDIKGTPFLEIEALQGIFNNDIPQVPLAHRVDIAIASEAGILGEHDFLPSASTSPLLLTYLQQHPDYLEVEKIFDPYGKSYSIFLREPSFSPLASVEGLSEKSPTGKRELTSSKVKWNFASQKALEGILQIRFHPGNHTGKGIILLNGKEVGHLEYTQNTDTLLDIPISLQPNNNQFVIQFPDSTLGIENAREMWFSRIRILEKNGSRPVEQIYEQWKNLLSL